MVVLKLISTFLEENPLCACADEISTLKSLMGPEDTIRKPGNLNYLKSTHSRAQNTAKSLPFIQFFCILALNSTFSTTPLSPSSLFCGTLYVHKSKDLFLNCSKSSRFPLILLKNSVSLKCKCASKLYNPLEKQKL